jgi:methionyl-tRNA formyltransferase
MMKKKRYTITILVDTPASWFVPYADELARRLTKRGHSVTRVSDMRDIRKGDCAFFLSCEKIIPASIRERNAHNIVIHGSALPKGKGMSPLSWQILEGENRIPHTVFEAADRVDSGVVYGRDHLMLKGHELLEEIHERQGELIIKLALRFVDAYPPGEGRPQRGAGSIYRRRTPEDSELDPNASLTENFNALRIADNDAYPAFFRYKGHTYILKIYRKK